MSKLLHTPVRPVSRPSVDTSSDPTTLFYPSSISGQTPALSRPVSSSGPGSIPSAPSPGMPFAPQGPVGMGPTSQPPVGPTSDPLTLFYQTNMPVSPALMGMGMSPSMHMYKGWSQGYPVAHPAGVAPGMVHMSPGGGVSSPPYSTPLPYEMASPDSVESGKDPGRNQLSRAEFVELMDNILLVTDVVREGDLQSRAAQETLSRAGVGLYRVRHATFATPRRGRVVVHQLNLCWDTKFVQRVLNCLESVLVSLSVKAPFSVMGMGDRPKDWRISILDDGLQLLVNLIHAGA